ncbi:hypothetical protein [Fibrobacter sp.]|uniref:hypothetical protein n=1 Tax=Fibrobacter sp. TaxID=35828 RepID=UPI0025C050AD|nr:hypothetical protein [Fibrobacter sp.]MBR4008820.1 hypothetical protein [Fibrobacter sp.]
MSKYFKKTAIAFIAVLLFALNASAREDLGDWPKALYGQALLAEGSPLPNPAEYVAAVTRLLGQAAGK